MKMKIYLNLITLLMLLLNGCSSYQVKPVEVLSEEVRELNVTDKQHIYKLIEDEITVYDKMGNLAFDAGEYHNALKYYKIVNFYKGYSYIPAKKIKHIKKEISKKSIYHYKRALKSKSAKNELKELNTVMMYNPDYKQTRVLYEKSKEKPTNKMFLNSLESDLYINLLNPKHSLKNIEEINKKSKELHKYKYLSKILIQAKTFLKQKHKELLNKGISLYKNNDLKNAKRYFTTIRSIYKNDVQAKKYLKKIHLKKQKQLILTKASKALENQKYKSAIDYANRVLKNNPTNKQAKKILSQATKLSHKKIKKLLNEGKYNYLKKRLVKAKKIFNQVLEIDAKNTTALLYKSKIERQLKTITSLQ
jgi:predicted Zn-dependent protease